MTFKQVWQLDGIRTGKPTGIIEYGQARTWRGGGKTRLGPNTVPKARKNSSHEWLRAELASCCAFWSVFPGLSSRDDAALNPGLTSLLRERAGLPWACCIGVRPHL